MSNKARIRRLKRLESRITGQQFVVVAPNGARVALAIRDPLSLVLASFNRQWHAIKGDADPPSRYDPTLNLLASCDDIETDDPVFRLAMEQAKEARHERETGETRLALQSLETSKQEND